MIDGENKDIVEEVFSRSKEADDRVSALFAHLKDPAHVSVALDEAGPCDLKESPAAKDTDSSDNEPFQSANNTNYEFLSKKTIKNKKMPTEKNDMAILVATAVFILVIIMGSYLRPHGNDSTKMMQEKQYVSRSETVSPLEKQPLGNVQPESVPGKINKNSTASDRQHVINWNRLLDEIGATIPETVQLSVLERGDGLQLFLEGRAFSADALYDFIDALNANGQVKLAEFDQIRIGKWNSQDVLIFSISCSLVSDTKTPAI